MEVFRLKTKIGKKYKHAEYNKIRRIFETPNARYPLEKYYADEVRDVGTLVEIKEGGFADDRWRIDIFEKDGERIEVVYSYEGKTCFIPIDE
uniref:Uncharacterized protein n=1 Tax=viral metagenome TaxID=1070528 RepID=A0A6C0HS44_9ZZZZ